LLPPSFLPFFNPSSLFPPSFLPSSSLPLLSSVSFFLSLPHPPFFFLFFSLSTFLSFSFLSFFLSPFFVLKKFQMRKAQGMKRKKNGMPAQKRNYKVKVSLGAK
jgi:hypothetical protein